MSETLIKAEIIMCMKRYMDVHNSTWKVFLGSYLAEFEGAFLTKCNHDARFLPGTLLNFIWNA